MPRLIRRNNDAFRLKNNFKPSTNASLLPTPRLLPGIWLKVIQRKDASFIFKQTVLESNLTQAFAVDFKNACKAGVNQRC
jgi:hypothetical protein